MVGAVEMPISSEAEVSAKPPPVGSGHIHGWAWSKEEAGPSARDGLSELSSGDGPQLYGSGMVQGHIIPVSFLGGDSSQQKAVNVTSILKSFSVKELSFHSQARVWGKRSGTAGLCGRDS